MLSPPFFLWTNEKQPDTDGISRSLVTHRIPAVGDAFHRRKDPQEQVAAARTAMRAVVFSVLILSAILITILVLYSILHDRTVDAHSEFKLKLNATCNHGNHTGICKRQESCSSNGKTIKLVPCDEQDSTLVCCPNLTAVTETNIRPKRIPGEKAEEMCKMYGKTAYRDIRNLAFKGPKYLRKLDCDENKELTVGGENAKEREFPHMVQIGNFVPNGGYVEWFCSGSIVSPEYILSAAHCRVSRDYGTAMFGTVKTENTTEFFDQHLLSISEVHIHPDYNPKTNDNDLALYKLANKLNISERPICLDTGISLPNNMLVIATGFGFNEEQKPNDILQKVSLGIVDQGSCAKKYKKVKTFEKKEHIDLPKFSVCAYSEGKDTCEGDSGGPIQVRHSSLKCMYTLIGVTSFGINCSLASNFPSVYTKVSPYIQWIEDIVWPA